MVKSVLDKLYSALNELDKLLSAETSNEAQFQLWFERNPFVFEILCYNQTIPHPSQIVCGNGEEYIPDFLVRSYNGLWEIFELKRPDTKILKNTSRRTTFYSSFEEYISQCREYAQYYFVPDNRKTIEAKYNIRIQRELLSSIVAGVDKTVDKQKVHDLLFDRGNSVKTITYDDIRNTLLSSISLQTAHISNLPGLTYSSVLMLPNSAKGQHQFFCDFGFEKDKNRISVGTDNDSLFIKVWSDQKLVLDNLVAISDTPIEYDKLFNLHFEFGIAIDSTYLSLFIDGKLILHRSFEKISIHPSVFHFWSLGGDMFQETSSNHGYSQVILFAKTLSVEERMDVIRYFLETYEHHYKHQTSGPLMINMTNNQRLFYYNHPLLKADVKIPDEHPNSAEKIWAWYIADVERNFINHEFFSKYRNVIREKHPDLIGTFKETIHYKDGRVIEV
ncbi:Shedu anti-phage system protein SduA domain-containing protein [uncultured Pontibacter sp.]|uniref:Shedu anti-phage system protein SduA domain-containing protein n=1 Tax=uncultured Pontibacter sp. TaxID=453356 RepID=UPI00261DF8B7|nr:Shedu anti-phage system protein SduA domain-containing protein [uncultured Pontibacter sp.]